MPVPERKIATAQAGLAAHPGIKIISRGRGGGYGEAATEARPAAIASVAFFDPAPKSMRSIRGAMTISPVPDFDV